MTASSTLEQLTVTTVSVTYLIAAAGSFYEPPPVVLDHAPDPVREADGERKAFAFYYEGDGEIVLEDGSRPFQRSPRDLVRTGHFFIPSRGELLTARQVADRSDISGHNRLDILQYMELNQCEHVFVFGPEGAKRAYKYYEGADQLVPVSV